MDQNNKLDYSIKLNEWGYFNGPDICKCGGNKFTIQNYTESHDTKLHDQQ